MSLSGKVEPLASNQLPSKSLLIEITAASVDPERRAAIPLDLGVEW